MNLRTEHFRVEGVARARVLRWGPPMFQKAQGSLCDWKEVLRVVGSAGQERAWWKEQGLVMLEVLRDPPALPPFAVSAG